MSIGREGVAARIRALLSKTVENGCTEPEAISAALKASELLIQYGLSIDDLNIKEERVILQSENYTSDRIWKIADAIGKLTNCEHWKTPNGVIPMKVSFLGLTHEVEISHYLLDICQRAVLTSEGRLRAENALLREAKIRAIVIPFVDGMLDRLSERIMDMIPKSQPGQSLVVVRSELIERKMQELGVKLSKSKSRNAWDMMDSYANGLSAGNKVALSRGVESESSVLRISS